ncbi:hypothetical protein ACFY94_37820 [Streptomyces griseorubiginosus]|uniref:hypothetical protein n=1 Tax=Streptomyces griseorubiginosus TaxID=67304 RepID=UPI0036E0B50D
MSGGGFVRRVVTVQLVPCVLFVASFWVVLKAGAFTGPSHWERAVPGTPAATAGTLTALMAGTALLALLLQPFQVRAVRALEGYWYRWSTTAGLAGVLVEVQRRRWEMLREQAERGARGPIGREMRAEAGRRLSARPPADVLLPTALGNALRSGELSAGERYGLSTLSSWPRIYMQISDRMVHALSSTRDALDTAVNLCWSFLAVALTWGIALYDEPRSWWLCGAALVLASVAYKGAVTAAQAYSGLMHTVYDLHRFELLSALHHPLPQDTVAEKEIFTEVTARFTGRGRSPMRYHHTVDGSHTYDADRSAHAENMDDEPA